MVLFYILSVGAENCSLSLTTCKISNRCFGCVWLKENELGLFHFVLLQPKYLFLPSTD